jgi:hypothetical protein
MANDDDAPDNRTPDMIAAGVPKGARDIQQVPELNATDARLWQQMGGMGPDGKYYDTVALDTQADDPGAASRRRRGLPEPDFSNVSSPPAQTPPTQDSQDKKPAAYLDPHEFFLADHDPETLKEAATAGGIDVSKLPDSYWEGMSKHYDDVTDPKGLGAVQAWYKASGIGHFMNGIYAGTGGLGRGTQDSVDDYLASTNPQFAEQKKADQYFNANIQARIIDKGQYIDGNGNYNPPATYTMGKQLNDKANAEIALVGLGGVAAGRAAASGLYSAAVGTFKFMEAHPAAANILNQSIKWTAIGKIVNGMLGRRSTPIP